MRVVGGEWRSRRLRTPTGGGLRPSSDQLRESLFDILGTGVAGRGFVDAYAGTGAVGIEAYSRGARPVVWVEAEAAAVRLLRSNLASLGIGGNTQAIVVERRLPQAAKLLEQLQTLEAAGGAAYLFLDPPYDDVAAPERVLRALDRHPAIVAKDGRVIVESRRGAELPEQVGRWRRERVQRRGSSQLAFFEPQAL